MDCLMINQLDHQYLSELGEVGGAYDGSRDGTWNVPTTLDRY